MLLAVCAALASGATVASLVSALCATLCARPAGCSAVSGFVGLVAAHLTTLVYRAVEGAHHALSIVLWHLDIGKLG